METHDEGQAAEALTMIDEARANVADRLVTPWWYHPVLGVLVAGYIVVFNFHFRNTTVQLVAALVVVGGTVALSLSYQRLTGVWISGTGPETGRARRWAYAMGGVMMVGLASSLIVTRTTSLLWPAWPIAALVCVGVIECGRRFDNDVRTQLRAGG